MPRWLCKEKERKTEADIVDSASLRVAAVENIFEVFFSF
jgi:hypothetical protein